MKEKIKTTCLILVTTTIVLVGATFIWSTLRNQKYVDREKFQECYDYCFKKCSGAYQDCQLECNEKCK